MNHLKYTLASLLILFIMLGKASSSSAQVNVDSLKKEIISHLQLIPEGQPFIRASTGHVYDDSLGYVISKFYDVHGSNEIRMLKRTHRGLSISILKEIMEKQEEDSQKAAVFYYWMTNNNRKLEEIVKQSVEKYKRRDSIKMRLQKIIESVEDENVYMVKKGINKVFTDSIILPITSARIELKGNDHLVEFMSGKEICKMMLLFELLNEDKYSWQSYAMISFMTQNNNQVIIDELIGRNGYEVFKKSKLEQLKKFEAEFEQLKKDKKELFSQRLRKEGCF